MVSSSPGTTGNLWTMICVQAYVMALFLKSYKHLNSAYVKLSNSHKTIFKIFEKFKYEIS